MSSSNILIVFIIKLTFLFNCINPLPLHNLPTFMETYRTNIESCDPTLHKFIHLEEFSELRCQFTMPETLPKFTRGDLASLEMYLCMGFYNAISQLCDPNVDLHYFKRNVSDIVKDMTQEDDPELLCDNFSAIVTNMSINGSMSSRSAAWVDKLREGFQHSKETCNLVCLEDHVASAPCVLIYGINKKLHGAVAPVAGANGIDNGEGDNRFAIDDQTEKVTTLTTFKVETKELSKLVPKSAETKLGASVGETPITKAVPPVNENKDSIQEKVLSTNPISEVSVAKPANELPVPKPANELPIAKPTESPVIKPANVPTGLEETKVVNNLPVDKVDQGSAVGEVIDPVAEEKGVKQISTAPKEPTVTKPEKIIQKATTLSPKPEIEISQPIQQQMDEDDPDINGDFEENTDMGQTKDEEKPPNEPFDDGDIESDKSPASNIYIPRSGVVPADDVEVSLMPWYLMVIFCVFFVYISFTNKKKIVAYVVEGRPGGRHGRHRGNGGNNRPNTANYRKLDSNLEEAITSAHNTQPSHIIY